MVMVMTYMHGIVSVATIFILMCKHVNKPVVYSIALQSVNMVAREFY